MALTQPAAIAYDAYAALALEHPDRRLELYRGRVREKPGTSMDHNRRQSRLVRQLNLQTDDRDYEVGSNSARLRTPRGDGFLPDVIVIPAALVDAREGPTRTLETYDEPLPFVAEIWSPSTGDYDIATKLAEYQARGDHEIWRIHPIDKTVTAWRRQPDGSYQESLHTGGLLALWALPNVTINLDALLR